MISHWKQTKNRIGSKPEEKLQPNSVANAVAKHLSPFLELAKFSSKSKDQLFEKTIHTKEDIGRNRIQT